VTSSAPPRLASPRRLLIVLPPAIGFFATPFLPFASTPTLWLGCPALLWWIAAMVAATLVSLFVVEATYLADGGAERDRLEAADGRAS